MNIRHGDASATYDVAYRTSDGSARSEPVGVASARPCSGTLLAPAGRDISALGAPRASPSPNASATAAGDGTAAGPPLVAAVRVDAARYYHIDLAGIEPLGSRDVYHLTLRAYRDANDHPLTDLYVDPERFLVREARGEASGHYLIASGRVAGIVDFDRVGPYWLVEHERFDIAANAIVAHARLTATIDGSDFATPADLPGVAFPSAKPTTTAAARPTSSVGP